MNKHRDLDESELESVSGAGESVHPVTKSRDRRITRVDSSVPGPGAGGGAGYPELDDEATSGGDQNLGQG